MKFAQCRSPGSQKAEPWSLPQLHLRGVSWLVVFLFGCLLAPDYTCAQPVLPGSGNPLAGQTPLSDRVTITASEEWIRNYFFERSRISPDIQKLFQGLGSDEFSTRARCKEKLFQTVYVSPKTIDEFSRSPNPEIAYVAQALGKRQIAIERWVIHEVLHLIAELKPNGLLPDILALRPESPTYYERKMLPRCVNLTVVPGDLERLLDLAKSEKLLDQRIALWGLHRLRNMPKALAVLTALGAKSPAFKLESALANLCESDAECLPQLVNLLDAGDLAIRATAAHALTLVTGQWFGYVGSDQKDVRKGPITSWRNWLKNAATEILPATDRLMYRLFPRLHLRGNQLLAFRSPDNSSGLVWLTLDGQLISRIGNQPSYHVEFLEDGQLLSTTQIDGQSAVVKFSRSGERRWTFLKSRLWKSHPSEGGRVMVCCQQANRLIEVDSAGDIVWGVVTDGECNDAIRSPNQQIYLGTRSGLFVMDTEGEQRPLFTDDDVSCIKILPDGDLLTCSWYGGKVRRLTSEGEVRWELEVPQAASAWMDLEGQLYVSSGSKGFMIFDAERKVEKTLGGYQGRTFLR